MSKKILIGVGTRPEAIKLAPVIQQLKTDNNFEIVICSTGQHREMLDGVLDFFDIKTDIDFSLMKKSSGILDLSSQIMINMNQYLDSESPDLVIAQGDTTTAFMMALAAYYKKIPFAHVEAGLRTNNLYSPWPEEGNRRMTSAITSIHFAPTLESKKNLLNEGISGDTIFITGNTVIDALLYSADKVSFQTTRLDFLNTNKKIVLITGHRRENLGSNFTNIFGAIKELTELYPEVQFVFPMHPSPAVRNEIGLIFDSSALPENIFLIEPLEYPDFVSLMKQSTLIITDSGGIQEEAPSLNKPVLVTRDTTERPEGVLAGAVKLVGVKKKAIVEMTSNLLTDETAYNEMAKSINPYGDGTAAKQIHEVLKNIL